MPVGDIIWGEYSSKCTWPACPGVRNFVQGMSMNLQVGDMVPFDSSDIQGTTCPNCKRAKLMVVKSPDPPPIPSVKGFSRLPEK